MQRFLCSLLFFASISLAAQKQQYLTKLLRGETTVSQWESIEIGISAPLENRAYSQFVEDQKRGVNPYAANHLHVEFTNGKTTKIAPAFFMHDAQADEAQNKYVAFESEWPWRVRFAVPDTGEWQCRLLVGAEIQKAIPYNCPIRFRCVKGKNHGYLKPDADGKRFVHSDGTPFFVLGQNITWTDLPTLHGYSPKHPMYLAGYYDVLHYIDHLAANGGNYVRIDMIHWSTGIEWEQTGVYNQERAWAMDTMLRLAEARGLKVHLVVIPTFGFDGRKTKDEWHAWRKDFQKAGMQSIDLLRDSTTLAAAKQYLRYVHSRWAYSPTVATIELVDELVLWEGYKKKKENFDFFFHEMRAFIENDLGDKEHMISTSLGRTDSPNRFRDLGVDFADTHFYALDFEMNQDRYRFWHRRSFQKLNMPLFFGEMGIINGPVNACDPDDWDYCSDISMHNSLWATTFMGGAGAGLYWWQWKNDAFREANYKPLRWFIDSVANSMGAYREEDMWEGNGLEVFYSKTDYNWSVAGWAHNESYWYGNTTDSCRDRDGKIMLMPKDDDKATKPEERGGEFFLLRGLQRNNLYYITLYDTRVAGRVVGEFKVRTNFAGTLRLSFPMGYKDVAFRAVAQWKTTEQAF
jgi:hypothetical protein